MSYPWYRGQGKLLERPVELPDLMGRSFNAPSGYIADAGLRDAANVSLYLGQPLLLTGEPGTGKTDLAYSLAWELGLEPLLRFQTKSTSIGRDLLYMYDTVGRFNAAQDAANPAHPGDFISWGALGESILRAMDPTSSALCEEFGFSRRDATRSVVLIDEIDKAPRDFPNDLLDEIERFTFAVPELGNASFSASPSLKPIVVITSNSEKHLSEAFLRRCIYYNISFPEPERLERIVLGRLSSELVSGELLEDALDLFGLLRSPAAGLAKNPSTAELLAWLRVLSGPLAEGSNPLRRSADALMSSLGALVKTDDDLERAGKIMREWFEKRTT